MCGICGLVLSNPSAAIDPEMLQRMTERYRGPDSSGIYLRPGIGLSVRRLAINDLETGDQPISNEDETITLICNGEIYNFHELRQELLKKGHRFRSRSDVEVIVHLYEDQGIECLHRLRGMFAFALWDRPRRRLMLARDRLGIKPLHYAITPEGCYFGSELKSILIAGAVERRLDVASFQELFTLGFITAPRTLFTDIRRLEPGHYLLYQDGRASLHRYWDLVFPRRGEEDHATPMGRWSELLLEKLRESVRIHLRSDVPVGAWLSPGIDSSSIVSLMSELAADPVQTLTLAFEDRAYDETARYPTLDKFQGSRVSNQQVICKSGDLDLLPDLLWHREDPTASSLGIAHLLLSRAGSASFKVALTGEGSDELFGGYDRFKYEMLFRRLSALPLGLRRLMLEASGSLDRWPWASRLVLAPPDMNRQRYNRVMGPPHWELQERLFSEHLHQAVAQLDHDRGMPGQPADLEAWHPFSQLQYYETKLWLPDFVTHDVDRTSMAFSLETRLPFLDHELVELCARIPVSLKMRGLREKYILCQAMRGRLPAQILRRPKRGLRAPTEPWLRGKLPDFAEELLSAASIRKKGYFSPELVGHLLQGHRAGRNYAPHLIGVLQIQLWDDLFLHGCRPS